MAVVEKKEKNSKEGKTVEVAFRSITKRFPPDILANDRYLLK